MKSQKIISLNPSLNYKPLGEIDSSTYHEIDTKITKARKAQPIWSGFSISERVAFLEKLRQVFINPFW